jgi:hypothetical protein
MKLICKRVVPSWSNPESAGLGALAFESNNTGPGRRLAARLKTSIDADAFSAFGLVMDMPEPMLGNFVGNHFADGASVHPHKDSAPIGYAQVRCNWMLKKPFSGGNPVIDGEELDVNEGDLWLCIASKETHWSTPVSGGERLVFSFGALISDEQLDRVVFQGRDRNSMPVVAQSTSSQ